MCPAPIFGFFYNMKQYPSIDGNIQNKTIYAFDKLDGSNVRAEWSKKRGFYKFGTRKRLFDESDSIFGKAKNLIMANEEEVTKICKKERWQNIICFFEFYGPNSFAGLHEPKDEHQVTLFDVSVHKKGFLEPKVFLDIFDLLNIPSMLYHGKANQDFQQEVKEGILNNMTFEGVVCKGKYISPGMPLMFKIKNKHWVSEVKERHKDNKKLLKEML